MHIHSGINFSQPVNFILLLSKQKVEINRLSMINVSWCRHETDRSLYSIVTLNKNKELPLHGISNCQKSNAALSLIAVLRRAHLKSFVGDCRLTLPAELCF